MAAPVVVVVVAAGVAALGVPAADVAGQRPVVAIAVGAEAAAARRCHRPVAAAAVVVVVVPAVGPRWLPRRVVAAGS